MFSGYCFGLTLYFGDNTRIFSIRWIWRRGGIFFSINCCIYMLNVQYQWDIIICINEAILLYSLFMVPSQTNSLLSPNVKSVPN